MGTGVLRLFQVIALSLLLADTGYLAWSFHTGALAESMRLDSVVRLHARLPRLPGSSEPKGVGAFEASLEDYLEAMYPAASVLEQVEQALFGSSAGRGWSRERWTRAGAELASLVSRRRELQGELGAESLEFFAPTAGGAKLTDDLAVATRVLARAARFGSSVRDLGRDGRFAEVRDAGLIERVRAWHGRDVDGEEADGRLEGIKATLEGVAARPGLVRFLDLPAAKLRGEMAGADQVRLVDEWLQDLTVRLAWLDEEDGFGALLRYWDVGDPSTATGVDLAQGLRDLAARGELARVAERLAAVTGSEVALDSHGAQVAGLDRVAHDLRQVQDELDAALAPLTGTEGQGLRRFFSISDPGRELRFLGDAGDYLRRVVVELATVHRQLPPEAAGDALLDWIDDYNDLGERTGGLVERWDEFGEIAAFFGVPHDATVGKARRLQALQREVGEIARLIRTPVRISREVQAGIATFGLDVAEPADAGFERLRYLASAAQHFEALVPLEAALRAVKGELGDARAPTELGVRLEALGGVRWSGDGSLLEGATEAAISLALLLGELDPEYLPEEGVPSLREHWSGLVATPRLAAHQELLRRTVEAELGAQLQALDVEGFTARQPLQATKTFLRFALRSMEAHQRRMWVEGADDAARNRAGSAFQKSVRFAVDLARSGRWSVEDLVHLEVLWADASLKARFQEQGRDRACAFLARALTDGGADQPGFFDSEPGETTRALAKELREDPALRAALIDFDLLR